MASAATLPLSWDYREVLEMASRPVGNGNISFGLVSIPVRLFPATRSKAVSFNLLHAKDLSRIQQKIYCPVDDAIIDRSELVRGYEVAKGRYVTFTDEELKQLDKFVRDNTIERFGPVRSVRADKDFGLVLEVAFEGLQRSTRHKSGVAMRFPRINRIRWDKPAREADELSTLEKMLE